MMAAEPVTVPVFVVGLPQLPASILALPDMDATVMLPDTPPTWMLACPLISASTLRLRTLQSTFISAPSVIVPWTMELVLKTSVRALSFTKSEAREVGVFVRHCITRERVEIGIFKGSVLQ